MRKIIPVVAAGATTLALAGTTFGYANLNKSVALSVDGQASQVRTSADTVAALLKSEGIEVNNHDVVAPNLDAKVADGTRVAIKFGREVTFTIDGAEQTIWTTATTVDEALNALAVDLAGAELSASRSSGIGRQGLAIIIATEKTVVIIDAGKKRTVTTTGQTLADALTAAKITVDHDDKLSASPNTRLADGTKFTFTRVDIKSKTKKVKVDFDTTRKRTSSLNKGVTKIDTPGVSGVRAVTYRLVRHNGEIVRRTKIKSKLIKKPVTEVILVGTKTTAKRRALARAPRARRRAVSGTSSLNASPAATGRSTQAMATTVVCSSASAHGARTGVTGYPHQASRDEQIRIAKKLQADAGWGAWPACSSKLGLR